MNRKIFAKKFLISFALCVVFLAASALDAQAMSFNAAVDYPVGSVASSVAVGDFNSDGNPDLAVANHGSNNISILTGAGDGTFSEAVNYAVGSWPYSVAVGDFNRDGNPDLATANDGSNSVSILMGVGDGTFQAAVNYAVGSAPWSVAVGDFNSDGNPDLATANYASNNVSILTGVGDGTFQAAVNYAVGICPHSVVVGDFNSDGNPDLATANHIGNNVSVLLNGSTPTPTPTPTSTPTPTPTATPAPSGLVSRWAGDGNANDSWDGNDAALVNGATFGPGLFGQAFQLDGVDDWVMVPSAPNLNFGTGDFTVGLWLNFTDTSTEQVLIEKWVEGEQHIGWTLAKLSWNSIRFAGPIPPPSNAMILDATPPAISQNTWYFVALSRAGNTYTIYWNGEEIGSTTSSENFNFNSDVSLKIGHRGNPDDTPGSLDWRGMYLNGMVDEVQIYNRALSDAEIADLFTQGPGPTPTPTPTPPPTPTPTPATPTPTTPCRACRWGRWRWRILLHRYRCLWLFPG